jgi:hypothetical protein
MLLAPRLVRAPAEMKAKGLRMEPFDPDFEIIKMDAEIGSYQEDFDPERERYDAPRARPIETEGDDAGA